MKPTCQSDEKVFPPNRIVVTMPIGVQITFALESGRKSEPLTYLSEPPFESSRITIPRAGLLKWLRLGAKP